MCLNEAPSEVRRGGCAGAGMTTVSEWIWRSSCVKVVLTSCCREILLTWLNGFNGFLGPVRELYYWLNKNTEFVVGLCCRSVLADVNKTGIT